MVKKVIVFAPHPDDETLVCGGTIAKKVREGYIAKVIVMTDGSHALSLVFGEKCEVTHKQLKEIRQEESIKAAEILGVSRNNVIFLDFEDQKLGESEKPAEGIITEILTNFCPDEVLLPYKRDSHRDHQAAFRIVTSSMRMLGFKKLVYQYANEQKYNPIWSGFDRFTNLFNHDLVSINISDFLATKKRAINEYKSQVGIIFGGQPRPLVLMPERYLKSKETFLSSKMI